MVLLPLGEGGPKGQMREFLGSGNESQLNIHLAVFTNSDGFSAFVVQSNEVRILPCSGFDVFPCEGFVVARSNALQVEVTERVR